jgi:hypothetical protein
MTDAAREADDLFQDFLNRMAVLRDTFQIQLTALAWKLAAEVVAKLPDKFAVGSLTWKDKDRPAKVVIPVEKPRKAIQAVIAPKVVILGPKPKERAERYQALLNRRSGQWSRRDGKVMYTVCDIKNFQQSNKAFYKMRRLDNGVEKWIKFASIVSDWKYFDA